MFARRQKLGLPLKGCIALLSLCVTAIRSAAQSPQTIQQRTSTVIAIRKALVGVDSGKLASQTLCKGDTLQVVLRFIAAPLQLGSDQHLSAPSVEQLRCARIAADSLHSQTVREKNLLDLGGLSGSGGTSTGAAIPSIFGIQQQTDIILGTFAYLKKRGQEEIAVSFVDEAEKRIAADSILSVILPATRVALQHFRSVSLEAALPTLRSAALEDLDELPVTVSRTSLFRAKRWTAAEENGAQFSLIALGVLNQMRKGRPPTAALGDLAELGPSRLTNNSLRYGSRTIGLLSREFINGDGKLREFVADTANRRYFFAFLVFDAIERDSLPPNGSQRAAMQGFLSTRELDVVTIVQELKTVQEQVTTARASVRGDSVKDVAGAIATNIANATQLVRSLVPVTSGWLPGADTALMNTVLTCVDGSGSVIKAVAVKDYNRAVMALIGMSKAFIADSVFQRRFGASGFRYATLVGNIAAAKSSDDVLAALTGAALPVGSFREKRGATPGSRTIQSVVGLNAYLGLGGGYEMNTGRRSPREAAGAFGATAPIGVEWSWGGARLPSFSLFVPVVDLGAVASYRLASDTTAENPQVGFEQIFAPGLYAVFGLARRVPLSLGFGWQYGAQLRELRGTGTKVSVLRFGGFLGIDMPLFRF